MTGLLKGLLLFCGDKISNFESFLDRNSQRWNWRLGLLFWLGIVVGIGAVLDPSVRAAEQVSLATFNLENYLLNPNQGRSPKPQSSRLAVKNALLSMRADVVALQEIGSETALLELRQGLEAESLSYPHHAITETPGSPIHVAVLSRFPITQVSHHVTNVFVLYGKAFRPSRGFLEVDIAIPRKDQLKVFVAHLKSKRPVGYADQWDLRTREALLLRSLVDSRLKQDPAQLLAIVGDFNDGPASQTLKFLRGGKGSLRFIDARPSEGIAGGLPGSKLNTGKRSSVWTHFFADEDVFSRVDFILMNRSLSHHYRDDKSYILDLPDWGQASDHRPVLANFPHSNFPDKATRPARAEF
jgi:endonuclease/exonuclease/phosphatase family metal-dependent hydrolase